MAQEDEPLQIIGNESNMVYELEPVNPTHPAQQDATRKEAPEQPAENSLNTTAQRSNAEIATNDGAIIETLDTAFHNKPGLVEGSEISGSNRADYYESQSYGKTDSEEELDALNNQPQ